MVKYGIVYHILCWTKKKFNNAYQSQRENFMNACVSLCEKGMK